MSLRQKPKITAVCAVVSIITHNKIGILRNLNGTIIVSFEVTAEEVISFFVKGRASSLNKGFPIFIIL